MRRISVHVAPRLLSDGLLLELSRRSVYVTPIHMPDNDVAIVSEPAHVTTGVIIELREENSARVHVGDEIENRECRTVDELLALIDEFAP